MSCSRRPETRPVTALKTSRRAGGASGSRRRVFQPETRSNPSSSFASRCGISAGSSWRSPSIVTTRLALRLREPGRERGRLAEVAAEADDPRRSASRACRRVSAENVPSVEPSSTKIASHGSPERLERRLELLVEQGDAPLLVVHRDDDRDHAVEPSRAAAAAAAARSWRRRSVGGRRRRLGWRSAAAAAAGAEAAAAVAAGGGGGGGGGVVVLRVVVGRRARRWPAVAVVVARSSESWRRGSSATSAARARSSARPRVATRARATPAAARIGSGDQRGDGGRPSPASGGGGAHHLCRPRGASSCERRSCGSPRRARRGARRRPAAAAPGPSRAQLSASARERGGRVRAGPRDSGGGCSLQVPAERPRPRSTPRTGAGR